MTDKSCDDDRQSHRLELPSPFPVEPGAMRLYEPPAGFGTDALEELRAGTLGRPFIVDCGRTRNLLFTVDAVQSAMRIDDPDALVVPYTRKMMAFLLFRPMPCHVLMIGLGGGSLAKFCHRRLPRTRITVVEINPEVIALRDEFTIPRDDERFRIVCDDGAAFLRTAGVSPDVILIDAFDEVGVSPSLDSAEFYAAASRCLAPDGVLVMNLSGIKSRYAAHIRSVRAAFPASVRLVPVDGEDNVLLFAYARPLTAERVDFLQQRARYLERRLGLEFLRYLGRLEAGEVLT